VDTESQLRLDRDSAAVRAFLESEGGALIRRSADPAGLYWAQIQPPDSSLNAFVARLVWSVYPDRAPSLLFARQVGGPTDDARAWPAAAGYRAPNDVCKPFTAEGQALHPDWATGIHAWRGDGNPFLYVVETVQADIDRAAGARAA
jgi:hypothetical protein